LTGGLGPFDECECTRLSQVWTWLLLLAIF